LIYGLSYKYLEGIPPLFFHLVILTCIGGHVANNESFDVKEVCLLHDSLLDYCLKCSIDFAE
jgi:hypothetical protein